MRYIPINDLNGPLMKRHRVICPLAKRRSITKEILSIKTFVSACKKSLSVESLSRHHSSRRGFSELHTD